MLKKIIITAAIFIMTAGLAPGMDHSANAMSAPKGEKIRSAVVKGYRLQYYLIDMKTEVKEKGLKTTPGIKSHHLMLYLTDMKGKMTENGRVGYLITTADDGVQKVMTMVMNMGHGGDVDLKPGENRIKTKILINGNKLVDEFVIRRP